MQPDDRDPFEDFDVIHTYTRAQAIEDGVLVDLMQNELGPICREAGILCHAAMTIGAFEAVIGTGELPPGQSINGRLWDVLMLFRCAAKKHPQNVSTTFDISVWDGEKHLTVTLQSMVGPGDRGELVLTFMLPGED